ncbi:type III-A CRISPR-associated protein Cas10/Csm1 [Bacteroides sp. AN502(2024)]|uniref:type III-A CRISPR-associated protein Cas10/Csm1 n=1 Tax=Bacteroides sp. AN502(2024) TaxID=3160599 RepID=UPI003518D32B
MSTIREHVYLAALLHDIGKFYQRADSGNITTSKFLKPIVRGLESIILPSNNKGVNTHKHCLWTAQFLEDYQPVFQRLATNKLDNLTDKDNLINLSAGHHLSFEQQTELGKIIKKADNLSSGMDRDSDEAYKDDQDESGWDSFKKKRMTSILQNVKDYQAEIIYHLPLKAISLDKGYFPKVFAKEDLPDYSTLWKSFNNEFKLIQANTCHAFAETFLNLLFKYTTAIPASTIHFPDVSLYDHLKTTAAIAVCLYDYQQAEEKGEKPFLMIGADFSGIQNYIYQVISKYASKNLKGRSFYLRILSDCIVRYLLKELNLFQANIIYNSGGSFYLLAPNTMEVRRRLESAISYIDKSMFEAHGTTLYIAIDSVEVSEDALMHRNGENLVKTWTSLFEKRNNKKQNKYSLLITTRYDLFFEPYMPHETMRDVVTGELFGEKEAPFHHKEIEEDFRENAVLKELTVRQILLGKMLRGAEVLVVSEGEITYWRDKIFVAPANLGIYYYLLNFSDLDKMKEQLRASADKVTIVSLNGKRLDCDFLRNVEGLNNIYSLEFYGGNIYPKKTFEEMCENDSFSRLGVLRMDVDNLGSIFQNGIAPERATLSRYAALSRSFDYFFSGYLNRIQQELAPDTSFIVYSGGDDVFIVGEWSVIIKLAKRIYLDFKEFTCHNPSFSLSGGIAIVPRKYPIIKGAEQSDKEEKNAKEHFCGVSGGAQYELKNSLSFMNTPLNWNKEFPQVEQLKDAIVTFIDQGYLPKSFISKVQSYAMNAQISNHCIQNLKIYWMLTYDLIRMKKTLDMMSCKEMIENCIKEICGNKATLNGEHIETCYHPLELWTFATRWAELECRTNKK